MAMCLVSMTIALWTRALRAYTHQSRDEKLGYCYKLGVEGDKGSWGCAYGQGNIASSRIAAWSVYTHCYCCMEAQSSKHVRGQTVSGG